MATGNSNAALSADRLRTIQSLFESRGWFDVWLSTVADKDTLSSTKIAKMERNFPRVNPLREIIEKRCNVLPAGFTMNLKDLEAKKGEEPSAKFVKRSEEFQIKVKELIARPGWE